MSFPVDSLNGWWWVWRVDGQDFGEYRFAIAGNNPQPDWVDAETDAESSYFGDEPVQYIAERFVTENGQTRSERRSRVYIPRQECERCDGTGAIPMPNVVAQGDTTQPVILCDVCSGETFIDGSWLEAQL